MRRSLNVLVYGPVDKAEALSEQLETLGILCRLIREDSPQAQKPRLWTAGIVFAENQEEALMGLETVSKFSISRIPHIVVCPKSLPENELIDALVRAPAPAVQIASRVRALSRLHSMEEVARRRSKVTAMYGERAGIKPEKTEASHNVLYVGDASPRFMALQHALTMANTETIAAFSSYSAFDYLHERAFDAVVLNALEKRDTAFTISSAMRRNARLYHTPVLLLSDDVSGDAVEEAFARGVSDILPPSADDDEIRDRVLSLATERRRRRDAKAALELCRDPRTLDVDTGLFQSGFITSHIQDLLNASNRNDFAFSLCALDVSVPAGLDCPDETSTEKSRRQFAAMLRHLLRSEDAAARLNETTFIAVLPFTGHEGVDCVASRVSAIAECTAFESADPLKPFRLSVVTSTVETMKDETAEALIERAVRRLRDQVGISAQA